MTRGIDPVTGRPTGKKQRTNPDCPLPVAERHNSVRAGYAGCTCPDAIAAVQRDREADRARSRRGRVRRAAAEAAVTTTSEPCGSREVPARHTLPRADGSLPEGMRGRPRTRLERDLHARDDLACRGEDPELFFPLGTGASARRQEAAAKQVCGRCPALDLCGTVALQVVASHGVFGGFSAAERRGLRARGWAA